MDPIILPSIIGVGGTLLGVFAGIFINKLLAKGDIKIYSNKFKIVYCKLDISGQYIKTNNLNPDIQFAKIFLDIYLYNKSSDIRFIRDLKLIIDTEDNKITLDLNNCELGKKLNCFVSGNEIKFCNVNPKSLNNLILETTINHDIKELERSKYSLSYKNYKNKSRIVTIKKY